MKKKNLQIGVLGMCLFVMFSTTGLLMSVTEGAQNPSTSGLSAEKASSDQLDQTNPQGTDPVLPPTSDPEMVVKPNVPPDPDAVVTPPVVDPEMAVDPASGERLTPEKLERLTPEEFERDFQEPQQRKR